MEKRKFAQEATIIDADVHPRYTSNTLSRGTRRLSTMIFLASASLITLIVLTSLMIGNWSLYLQSMSLLLQLMIWIILIGVPAVVLIWCLKKIKDGIFGVMGQFAEYRALSDERHRANALNAANINLLNAQAAKAYAEAMVTQRTIPFDANGNAAVIGVPMEAIQQIRGQVASRSQSGEQKSLPAHASSSDVLTPTFDEAVAWIEKQGRNSYQVFLGRSITEPDTNIIAEIPDNHLLLIGATRMGKSCEACMIIDQMTHTHDPEHLQIALLDLEDQNCNLFADLPHVVSYEIGGRQKKAIARTPEEVAEHMGRLVGVMDRRYELSPKERAKLPRIIIYVEEFVELKRRLKDEVLDRMADHFTSLATRGLKANMHLMVCAQASYSQEEFREAMGQLVGIDLSFCARPKLAQAAGFINYDLLNQNYQARTPGQFVIEATGQSDIAVAVSYDVKAKLLVKQEEEEKNSGAHVEVHEVDERPRLYAIEGGAHPTNTLPAPSEHLEVAPLAPDWMAYAPVIARLQREGHNQDQIIEKIWKVKKGSNPKYLSAREMYRSCNEAIKQKQQEQFEIEAGEL